MKPCIVVGRQRASAEYEQTCTAHHLPLQELQELQELQAVADFAVFQVPYTPETHHLIGGAELALKKKSAILINTVHTAGVDDNALAAELLAAPNVTLLAHSSSASPATPW